MTSNKIVISKRLKEIAYLAKDYNIVVDFGCDHGFCLKELFDKYNIKKGYAIDNKKEPLLNAKNNLKDYNIDFIKTSSFKELNISFDCCIISGMGYKTIINILNTAPKNACYIIGSNTKNNIIRRYLSKNNFQIVTERIVFENNKYYEIIKTCPGKMNLDEEKEYTGIYLKEDTLYSKYKKYIIKKIDKLIINMPKEKKEDYLKIRKYFSD